MPEIARSIFAEARRARQKPDAENDRCAATYSVHASVMFTRHTDVAAVPSRPLPFTSTVRVGPGIDLPLIPAMKAAVCVALVPIRIVFEFPATPGLATSMLLEPVVRLAPAPEPSARLELPVVFERSASRPLATLALPVVFEKSASRPLATL